MQTGASRRARCRTVHQRLKPWLPEIAKQSNMMDLPWLPTIAKPSQAPFLERPDRLPLVGRKSELSVILNQVEALVKGVGGLFLLSGEPGIGKTRLLQELSRNVEWRGIRTASGRCYELSGSLAYQPLVEVFRSDLPALNGPELEPLWRTELPRLLPELSTGAISAPLKPEEEQNRLLEAIVRGFQALSIASLYLIILEDAHWMDPASLAALRYLLPRIYGMPLLIIISLREMELSQPQIEAFSSLDNTRIPRRLELNPLNMEETGELVQRSLELNEAPVYFSSRLYTETEGNPFFFKPRHCGLWLKRAFSSVMRLAFGAHPGMSLLRVISIFPLPKGVAQSIQRRLDHLSKPAEKPSTWRQ